MKRHDSRETAFLLLFEYSFGGNEQEIVDNAVEYRELTVSTFAGNLFFGTVTHINEIDALISEYSENRAISRIARVPLACLRLAAYEMLFTDTGIEIIANEAVDICRAYNCDDSVSFVNGVLAKIAATARPQ